MDRSKPLYRKVNTRARGVHHHKGGAARHDRNTKRGPKTGMAQGVLRGLDYTPLFRFLLSRVGSDWNEVHHAAVSRLDREDALWILVSRDHDPARAVLRTGESSYWSGLWIDEAGRLALVDPSVTVERLNPQCPCCTHSFNGQRFTRRFAGYPPPPLVDGPADP